MSVYQPGKSPYFHYDFQISGVRHHGSTGATTKTAAREFERRLRAQLSHDPTRRAEITLDEACGLYWEERGKFEASESTTESQLARLVALIGKDRRLSALDRLTVDHFIARRRAMPARNLKRLVSNATVNREVELLGRIMRLAARKGYAVAAMDWRGIKLKEAGERIRELSDDEERRLFASLNPDLAAVVEFALLSGQRRTGVITLLWSRVDLVGGRAQIRLKGGKWHSFPLTPRMTEIIATRPKVGPFVFTYRCQRTAPARGDRPARLKGERYPFSKGGWARQWHRALDDAGIEDFRFHDLRHTAATRVTRAIGNLKVTQRLLGHASIATTARYAHAIEEDVRAALIAAESRNFPEPSTQGGVKNDRNDSIAA